MKIKKALTEDEVLDFDIKYSNEEINTIVIANVLQPSNEKYHAQIKDYCDFWWPRDHMEQYNKVGQLQFLINNWGAKALKKAFGKHDFEFEGNRTYYNYVLNYDDLTIMAPSNREVVVKEEKSIKNLSSKFVTKLIHFEQAYCQLVIDYAMKHLDKLSPHEQIAINSLKQMGLITEDNQVDFNYFKNLKKEQKIKP